MLHPHPGMLTIPPMKQHILVVDDEAPIRELLTTYFTRRGYSVTPCANGADTLRAVDEIPLSLVILDLALVDDDGLELLERIKRSHPNLAVIILTGMGFDEDLLQEAKSKGADGYVSKTLPLEQLHMEVRRVLKHP